MCIWSSFLIFFEQKMEAIYACPRKLVLHGSSFQKYTYSLTHNKLADFFDHLLQQCATTTLHHRQTKQIHAQIILTATSASSFLTARLISLYSKHKLLSVAKMVFKTAPVACLSDKLLWNSILRANVTHKEYNEALRLYCKMRKLNVLPDGFSFPLILKACGVLGEVRVCEMVHCNVMQMGFENNLHVLNEMLGMYGKISCMGDALKVFDRMSVRSILSWNVMVSGFSLNFDCDAAFRMFSRMEVEGWEPNSVTWTSLLSSFARCERRESCWELFVSMRRKGIEATGELLAVVVSVCIDMSEFDRGKMVHGYVVKGGFEKYSCVRNSLICVYGKCGDVKEAEYLFSGLEGKSLVSWNALISSYADSGLCNEAFAVFSQLQKLDGDLLVRPDVVSWTAVIGGFAAKGRYDESLELFRKMQSVKVVANAVTVATVLMVCAELSALRLGREIHAHVIRGLTDCNILVGNGLINMYMKCGSLNQGHLVFQKIKEKDLFTWNTMIAGYGMHGLGDNALRAFDQMISEAYKPDEVSFVAALSACGHAGLVSRGRQLFDLMRREFRIEPQVEHYACMVDLLGRAGLLREASDLVRSMPMEPNAFVWGSLLNSCKMYKNTDVAEETAMHILSSNSGTTGSFMLLSDLYAASGRWKDSARIRLLAKMRGLKKIPGQSWIEVKNKVRMFLAGESTIYPGMEDLAMILNNLNLQMEMEGYGPGKSCIPQTNNEENFPCSSYEELNLYQL